MNILDQFKHQWQVFFKRGEGQAIVYGNNEVEATQAAVAMYRKQKTMVDFCKPAEIIETLRPIS